jgi:hypothetical protein
MCKIVFTVPFYRACEGQPICLLSCYTAGLQSWQSLLCNLHLPAQFPTISLPSSLQLNRVNREKNLKKQEGVVELVGHHLSFPSILWRSWVGPCHRLHKSTYKTS